MNFIKAASLPEPAGHYSQAVEHGGMVWLSGVLPAFSEQGALPSFEEQAKCCFDRCEAILDAAGCTLHDVVSCTIYIADIELWPLCNSLYAERMGAHKPARAVVPVPGLHHGFSLEVQMTAVKGK